MPTILVIDDDPDALLLVEAALSRAGHRVVTSNRPDQIAALAADHGADAVVLDVLMPEVSGHEALRALRAHPRTGGVPVLLLSSKSEGEDRVEGLRRGADDFLSKPFEPEELQLRIQKLVAQHGRTAGTLDLAEEKLEEALETGELRGPLYLGRYQALEVVGRGGSGLVFRGWDPWLKRPVALKTMALERLQAASAAPDDSGSGGSDLLQEAVTVARFSHPHIVTVYDVGRGRRFAFLAMEYVEGTSLAAYLDERGPIPRRRVVPLALAMARGLRAAHGHKIVHHDVKPGNILLGRNGSVKVSDFGVAQLVTSLGPEEDVVFGTPGYLPPEVLLGEPYSERGDLFGLGVVLFQCLAGELPFGGTTLEALVLSTVRGDRETLGPRLPELPALFETLLLSLLAKDPSARPESAAEVVDVLRGLPAADESWTVDLPAAAARGPYRPESTSRVIRRETLPLQALE